MAKNTAMIIAENIRIQMAINNIHVTDMANNIGISRNTITNLKSGRMKMIQIRTLENVANYFEITVGELVTEHHLGVS
ncbi:hypothetical protein AMBR_LLDLPDMO_01761 [Lactiplantibacillus plantarum]|uniref:Prophage protein, Xre family n=1 Tax=Lactiplantibacillus plantarum CMPG5300 TaxID=1304889 RepID=A0AAW3FJW7_LACPN|nr:helix-turn-helix transcriptional regulator [Lactiplantibacillus plantarum]KGH41366.1 prophage protein, Xre family [Lactiplantibacillus plantarum CMPG5300]MBP5841115.1 helix-turn-helix transcriptional regulator [Lactiplantibacillus plantarum]MCZ2139336.1 helix-turn-helix transcriptional regulator [Lactiplantibacillus plantarum]MCZ2275823.1 helix-turn-helix transcriptional regulator [Lactiplantibacillus plantarum]VTU56093.1 hypothetical protein AMBR_LLDLPDMO_01761 [Lactiplantibacillus plantar